MKSILYIGALLMIGAGIYGFVDYKQTSRNMEFTKMYDSNDEPTPIIANRKTTDIISESTTTKGPALKNKKNVKSKTIAPPAITDSLLKNVLDNENLDRGKEKKVLSYRLFSRAPLERKYINKELKLDSVKTENKEQ